MTDKELCRLAIEAREKAYAPYSGYRVGAALLAKSGEVYLGSNIENAAYTPTVCAERTAFFKAVSEGETEFFAIAVAGGNGDKVGGAFPPCGVCRQVMAEFCDGDFKIFTVTGDGMFEEYTLTELLPLAFSPKNLERK
ncbi:MAG: cytidine deaminase [Clostridia bacterium]|nr:cytidine deaminase [Clostridia bacterium]